MGDNASEVQKYKLEYIKDLMIEWHGTKSPSKGKMIYNDGL